MIRFVLALTATASVAHAQAPLAATRELLDALKEVRSPPAGGSLSPADAKATRDAVARLDRLFDLGWFGRASFAPHRKALGDKDSERLEGLFVQIVRLVAYRAPRDLLVRARLDITADPPAHEEAAVRVRVTDPQEGEEIELRFQWVALAGAWRAVDVSFDGDSLVKDYQNQLGRILAKEGVAGLEKKLKGRLARELADRGPLP